LFSNRKTLNSGVLEDADIASFRLRGHSIDLTNLETGWGCAAVGPNEEAIVEQSRKEDHI
jgi:hypothetical protein